MKTVNQHFSITFKYPVHFTRDIFAPDNPLLAETIVNSSGASNTKVTFVVDQGVHEQQTTIINQITTYCAQYNQVNLALQPAVIQGGEAVKNNIQYLLNTLEIINTARLDRHACFIAIGGGALLDMVGFAAAISHRGIRHLRIPSTVLSQNDAGMGVKNGINYFGKKNFLGTFTPPAAVINDSLLLTTLNNRDWIAGIAEAIKVALVKSPEFFNWIANNAAALKSRDLVVMEKLIFQCARMHLQHIASSGDAFEQGSSRPLDFGHWSAHRLEQLSNYQVKHGEAVALGLAMDITYSKIKGFLSAKTWQNLIDCLRAVGFSIFHPLQLNSDKQGINPSLLAGLDEFREHMGGELTIILISNPGESFEVHHMDADALDQAVVTLYELHSNNAC